MDHTKLYNTSGVCRAGSLCIVFSLLLCSAAFSSTLVLKKNGVVKVKITKAGDVYSYVPINENSDSIPPSGANLSLRKNSDTKMRIGEDLVSIKGVVQPQSITGPLAGDLKIFNSTNGPEEVPQAGVSWHSWADGDLIISGNAFDTDDPVSSVYYVDDLGVFVQTAFDKPPAFAYAHLGGNGKTLYADDAAVENVYYIKDHLGSVRCAVNELGTQVEAVAYAAYGTKKELVSSPPTTAVRERFTGKEFDQEGAVTLNTDGMNLYYFGARYYDPEIGYWLAPDKAAQFFNMYAYAGNGANPVVMIDADGNFIFTTGFLVAAGIAAAVGGVTGGVVAARTDQNVFAGIGIGMGIGLVTAFTGGAASAGVGAATASMAAAGGWAGLGAATLTGAAAGAAGGFTGGFLNTVAFSGQNGYFSGDVGDAFSAGVEGMWKGALVGGASGAAMYGLKTGASALADRSFQKASAEFDARLAEPDQLAYGDYPGDVKSDAFSMTDRFAMKHGISGSAHNTNLDAFRHQYWQGKLTSRYGKFVAEMIGNMHESAPNLPFNEVRMDLGNNYIGRSSSRWLMSSQNLFNRIESNILSGNWVNLQGIHVQTGNIFIF